LHVVDRIDTQTQVMQTRRVRIVDGVGSRRADHDAEVAVVVLHVRIAADREAVLAEAEHALQNRVVVRLGARQVGNRQVHVVEANDVEHAGHCTAAGYH
jgi:hypothetical protein